MNTNDQNPRVGKEFQKMVCGLIEKETGSHFEMEVALPIGNPPKLHKYDCVSLDKKTVVECKCYTWTDTGNVPSAKLMGMNEAVFYMSYLEPDVQKILAVKKAVYPGKKKLWQNTTIELTVIFLRELLCWKLMKADKSE